MISPFYFCESDVREILRSQGYSSLGDAARVIKTAQHSVNGALYSNSTRGKTFDRNFLVYSNNGIFQEDYKTGFVRYGNLSLEFYEVIPSTKNITVWFHNEVNKSEYDGYALNYALLFLDEDSIIYKIERPGIVYEQLRFLGTATTVNFRINFEGWEFSL